MRIGLFILTVLIMGCEKTAFNPPVLEPEIDSNFVFNDGNEVSLQAGVNGYYLYTDSYISNNKKVYRSRLSNDINCDQNCNPDIALEIHQGNISGSLDDIDFQNLDYLNNNSNQDVKHEFQVINNTDSVFNHVWKVGSEQPNNAENISLNQDIGLGSSSIINLIFRTENKAIVKLEQDFSPIAQEASEILIQLSKSGTQIRIMFDSTTLSKVYTQGRSGFNFEFNESVSQVFHLITVSGNIIKGTVIIPADHPSFSQSEVGYKYTNIVEPIFNQSEIERLEVIYRDQNGMVFRSSAIDQIIPTTYELEHIENFVDNESGMPTIRCEINISCLLYSNQTKETLYIKEGTFRFAFVNE